MKTDAILRETRPIMEQKNPAYQHKIQHRTINFIFAGIAVFKVNSLLRI